MSALASFLSFYGVLYAAFGVASPFFPGLLQHDGLGPAQVGVVLAGLAGMIRWSTVVVTAWFPAMMLTAPLHGLTFALLHLAWMEVIGRVAPASMAATVQTVYGTLAMGATTAAAPSRQVRFTNASGRRRSGRWRYCARSRFRSRREYGCPRTSGPVTKLVGAVSSNVSERQLSGAAG